MLKRFTLKKDNDGWALFNQHDERLKGLSAKEDALKGGVLENLIGEGTVRIHRDDGQFEEERTFPRYKDPRESTGYPCERCDDLRSAMSASTAWRARSKSWSKPSAAVATGTSRRALSDPGRNS